MYLKENLKFNYKIGPIIELDPEILNSSSGLILINANKKPPHLAVFCLSKYYSVSVNDVHIGIDIDMILEYIHRKKVPTIFIPLKESFALENVDLIFKDYDHLSDKMTCLHPIKKLFSNINGISDIDFIYELIPLLNKLNMIQQYFHIYADDFICEEKFQLRTYTMDQIKDHIKKVDNDNRQKSTT